MNEVQRREAIQAEMRERIAQAVPEDGHIEPIEHLALFRQSSPTASFHSVSAQAFCVIAQGSKHVLLGDDQYRYDPAHYLITTAGLPIESRVVDACEMSSPRVPPCRSVKSTARRERLSRHRNAVKFRPTQPSARPSFSG